MARTQRSSFVPPEIEEFVRALIVTAKAVVLYPPASNIPRETARLVVRLLDRLLRERADLRLSVARGGHIYFEKLILPDKAVYRNFAHELYGRNLAEVRFHAGTKESDVVGFLSALRYSPEELDATGGWEARLWEQGVSSISVVLAGPFTAQHQGGLASAPDEDNPRRMFEIARSTATKPGVALTMLESALPDYQRTGDIVSLARAAVALRAAQDEPDLNEHQRGALALSLGRIGNAIDMAAFLPALRPKAPGMLQYEAAEALLYALGPAAVRLLLQSMANEADMARRKQLVDVLSELAPNEIGELSAHVEDTRWYVVRNVVSALGCTKSAQALPALEKALAHTDNRVRREAVRALSRIPDRAAQERLIRCLNDPDAQNVQLAARYLGLMKVKAAVASLEIVARGEGQGNRDIGPRVEAIESLARMGAMHSVHTLESLAKPRLVGRSKLKEVRAAAKAALEQLKDQPSG